MKKDIKKLLIIILCIIAIGIIIFVVILGGNKTISVADREMPEATGVTEELTEGIVVSQNFVNSTDNIDEIAVVFSRLYYLEEDDETVNLYVELYDGNNLLASNYIDSDNIPDQHRFYINLDNPLTGYVGKELTIKIYAKPESDTGLALMKSDSVKKSSYYFGNEEIKGSICFSITSAK